MSLIAHPNGGATFRSKPGGGKWLPAFQATGSQVNAGIIAKVPSNLAADRATRKTYGQVPAIGFLIELTVTADNGGGGSAPLYTTDLELLSYFSLTPQIPLDKKYTQAVKTLADWHFISQVVNPRAANLKRRFYDLYQNDIAPWAGLDPVKPIVDPSVLVAGTSDFQFFGNKNSRRFPETDEQDAYWHALEGRHLIRDDGNTETTVRLFVSIPLCYGTAVDGLMGDSIPLATLCDQINLWQWKIQQTRPFDGATHGSIVHSGLGGAIEVEKVGMYLYIMDRRMEDKRVCGMPFWVTDRSIAELTINYEKNRLYLFSGNFPRTVPNPAALSTQTVGGTDYICNLRYGNYNPDMLLGNQYFQYIGEEAYFPVDQQFAHPSELYEGQWNAACRAAPDFQRPYIRYGRGGDVSTIAGRATANLGYVNRIDADVFGSIHGNFSAFPVRVVAASFMELAGIPGFGAIDASCGLPTVKYNGTFDITSGTSGMGNLTDIVVNREDSDVTRIRDMGENCCRTKAVIFLPIVPDPSSPKAPAIAPYLPAQESDPASAAVPG